MDTLLDAAPASQDDILFAYTDGGEYLPQHAAARSPTLAEMLAAADPREDEIGLASTGEFEPGLRAALYEVIEELLAGSEAARDANASLRRQGDPLGLMDGDGITNEAPETNAPTPERVASRGTFESVNITVGAGRDAKADVWRHVSIVEAMIRRGQIHKDSANAYQEAGREYTPASASSRSGLSAADQEYFRRCDAYVADIARPLRLRILQEHPLEEWPRHRHKHIFIDCRRHR